MKKKLALCLVLVCIMALMAPAAIADGAYQSIGVSIPIKGTGTFVLADNNNHELILKKVVIEGEGEIALALDEPDTYEYYLYKENDTEENRGFRIALFVTVDESGQLHCEKFFVNAKTGTKVEEPTFSLTPYKDDPPVKKSVNGNPTKASIFTFVMTPKKSSFPMPDGSKNGQKEISITGPGEVEFGWITFSEPGSYDYSIAEKNLGEQGYTYDKNVYYVHYDVVEADGKLAGTRTISRNGTVISNAKTCEFINKYTQSSSGGGSSGSGGTSSNPLKGTKTGDTNSIIKEILILSASLLMLAGIVVVIIKDKKGKRQ